VPLVETSVELPGDEAKARRMAAAQHCGKVQACRDPAWKRSRQQADERLRLPQIGTDPKGGPSWGDDAPLYLWIRREDLRAHRVDQARRILQCH